MTKKSFENAIVLVMATGGSTNAVLHLIAMANACGVEVTLDDFQRISDKVPFIADLKPSGKYVMEDLHKVRLSRDMRFVSARLLPFAPAVRSAAGVGGWVNVFERERPT